MGSVPADNVLAVELAAHWRAILRAQPHQLRLPQLVRRQLPLMVAALGVRELAVPMRVQEREDMLRPKDLPDHFVVDSWTLHADLDKQREWACAMFALSSRVIQASYIERHRPNLFDEPYAWGQSGVHEAVQDNFRLPSLWLARIRKARSQNPVWYNVALGAHIAYCVRDEWPRADPSDDDLALIYDEWAATYDIRETWADSERLARRVAKLPIETPGHVVPLGVLTNRKPGLGVEEALWEYLADPARGFGLSHRAAAALIGVPYSTLSSLRTHRKNHRSAKRAALHSSRDNAHGVATPKARSKTP